MGGIAKGSGMIHPNMATLLSVITTDANVEPSLWHTILLHGVQKSFNQVSASCVTSEAERLQTRNLVRRQVGMV